MNKRRRFKAKRRRAAAKRAERYPLLRWNDPRLRAIVDAKVAEWRALGLIPPAPCAPV